MTAPTRTALAGQAAGSATAPARLAAAAGPGVVEQVTIPATTGFRPRPAYVYLPPAAVKYPNRQLPVLELLHGTPGGPADWINKGLLVKTMNAFAAAHGGQAPVVVVPDLNGNVRADSECIRTADGKDTETYLTRNVPAWVRSHFPRTVGRAKFWVAGLSEGGTCSLMLALRHPDVFSAIGDFSGSTEPAVDYLTPAMSDKQLYQGSYHAKLVHSPLWLLSHLDRRGMAAWFQCGVSDRTARRAQDKVVAAANAAHLVVRVAYSPGKHQWSVWSVALRDMLPWLWARR